MQNQAFMSNGHIFYICFETSQMGQCFERHMDRLNIPVRKHFVPLHISEMGKSMGYEKTAFSFESDIFERLYRLPVHTRLSETDIGQIVEAAREAIQRALEV
jgi:dTDP-4-amino-4,6-dideoxygalactose transaminase